MTNSVYAGRMRFNRQEARSGKKKSEAEYVTAAVPAIVEPQIFERVQETLKARNPKITPPRTTTGPILLTGLAKCSSCSENKLDSLVTDQLLERLLEPARLQQMLAGVGQLRAARAAEVDKRVRALEEKLWEAEERLRRLYALVELGHADVDDLLKDRISVLKTDREVARVALDRARGVRKGQTMIGDGRLQDFSRFMRERLTTGDIPFRKAYLGAIIDRMEVDDDRIRIFGRKDVLEQAVAAGLGPALPGVRTFVRKWRTRQDWGDARKPIVYQYL